MPDSPATYVIGPRAVTVASPDPTIQAPAFTAVVESIERREDPPVRNEPTIGLDARLVLWSPGGDTPCRFHLSRLIGETAWTIDAHFAPNGKPTWIHDFGARYMRTRGLPAELDELLNEATRLRALAIESASGVPLRLHTP